MSIPTPGLAPSHRAALGGGTPPDRLTLWPLDSGRYGLDAAFYGTWACEDAEQLAEQLRGDGMPLALRGESDGRWIVRMGPLSSLQVVQALAALAAS